jgi:aminopeptidase
MKGKNMQSKLEKYADLSVQMGVNDSMIHVDFMIGADDLDIDGITSDGQKIPVFRNGSWVF